MTALQLDASWVLPDWQVPSTVVALTTTRVGGASVGDYAHFNLATHVGDSSTCVQKNRELLRNRLDVDIDFQWLTQVHGTTVIQANRNADVRQADAALTTQANLACCVLTADCLPVFFASRDGEAVAVAHAGWRGLAGGILESTFRNFPASAENTLVWLGPAIGPCHFEVGEEVLEAFLAGANEHQLLLLRACFEPAAEPGKFTADLYQLARVKLSELGIPSISGGGFCTYCQAEQFYSFRRQKSTGRMASLIYLKSK